MHLGQTTYDSEESTDCRFPSAVNLLGVEELTECLALADMAAFKTKENGGGMPHVRHGGIVVASVAVDGSKLDGTGFVNVQMGHIQLPDEIGGAAFCI